MSSILETIENAEKAVTDTFASLTSQTIVNERSAGPGVAGPHISFLTVRGELTDYPIVEYADTGTALNETLTVDMYCTAQVTARGKNAYLTLAGLVMACQSAKRWTDLYPQVGYGGFDEVQDATTELGGGRIEQATVHFNFHILLTRTEAVDFITQQPFEIM